MYLVVGYFYINVPRWWNVDTPGLGPGAPLVSVQVQLLSLVPYAQMVELVYTDDLKSSARK
jgi:hypothetical protein